MPTVSTQAITAQQLQFQYSWSAIPPDDPRITGHADSVFISRHEGYEMLAFLNRTCNSLAQAQKAERGVRQHVPQTVRSRENVLTWLQKNWQFFD